MKMLCDYCDKRNECTKIISNKLCSEFAHKLSFIEISDSKEVYSLFSRIEHFRIVYFARRYIIDSSNAVKIVIYSDFGNKYILGESEIKKMNWFLNKDEAETVANILNSCEGQVYDL